MSGHLLGYTHASQDRDRAAPLLFLAGAFAGAAVVLAMLWALA